MEIKFKFKDLDVQGLNINIVREISCEQDTSSSVVDIQQQITKADAHWKRQLDVMEHTMKVLQRNWQKPSARHLKLPRPEDRDLF